MLHASPPTRGAASRLERRAQEHRHGLIFARFFEVVWTSLLDSIRGFSRLWPTVGFLVTLGVSMCLPSIATRTIPVGTGDAMSVGIGAVGAILVGVFVEGDETGVGQVAANVALVASIVAVKLTAA